MCIIVIILLIMQDDEDDDDGDNGGNETEHLLDIPLDVSAPYFSWEK